MTNRTARYEKCRLFTTALATARSVETSAGLLHKLPRPQRLNLVKNVKNAATTVIPITSWFLPRINTNWNGVYLRKEFTEAGLQSISNSSKATFFFVRYITYRTNLRAFEYIAKWWMRSMTMWQWWPWWPWWRWWWRWWWWWRRRRRGRGRGRRRRGRGWWWWCWWWWWRRRWWYQACKHLSSFWWARTRRISTTGATWLG